MNEKFEREINGVPYLIYVEEEDSKRVVQVMAPSQDRQKQKIAEEHGDGDHFFVFYTRDKREFPLPDVESHVADAVNQAVCKYKNTADQTSELRERIGSVLDAVESVHTDE